MKIYQLTKKFRFETAHRLSKDYVGKCANIHGHSWNGEIGISSAQLNVHGMAMDFADIKSFLKNVEDSLDHKLILWVNDPLVDVLNDTDTDLFLMQDNPTSEAIAEMIFNWAVKFFKPDDVSVDFVKIEETCTSSCTYTVDDFDDEDDTDEDY